MDNHYRLLVRTPRANLSAAAEGSTPGLLDGYARFKGRGLSKRGQ